MNSQGEKYLYEEDWGEQEVGLCHPVIVMFDTVSEKMEILNCVPNEISPGQVPMMTSSYPNIVSFDPLV